MKTRLFGILILVYCFTLSSFGQISYDLSVTSLDMTELVKFNSTHTVKGVITNLGSETITSFDLKYRVDSGSVYTDAITSSIDSGSTYSFSSTTSWTPLDTGIYYDIEVWATNLNGSNNDENTANDTSTIKIFVNEGISGTKRVLLEVITSVSDGEGPDLKVRMDAILENDTNVSAIVHHTEVNDLMTWEGSYIYNAFSTSYPAGFVDRILFDGESSVGLSKTQWASKITERLNAPTPVNINITSVTYSPSSRKASIQGTIDFVDYVAGDVRIAGAIYESTFWNSDSKFDQTNNYNYNSGHEYYDKGNPIVNYGHRHVGRQFLTDEWGAYVDQTIQYPHIFKKGSSYPFNLESSGSLAVNYNEDRFHAIIWVNMYNDDIYKREILTCAERKLTATYSISESYVNKITNVYPNPVSDYGRVDFSLSKTTDVSLDILNALGQKVYTSSSSKYAPGKHSIYFKATELVPGTYVTILKFDNQTHTKTFIK